VWNETKNWKGLMKNQKIKKNKKEEERQLGNFLGILLIKK